MQIDKKINLKLVGLDGNAFALLAEFKKQAKKEKWTNEEIKEVFDEAKSSDYYHLLNTISSYCK